MTSLTSWEKYCHTENWHEAANLFPMLSVEDAHDLADDIGEHDLHNPIVLFDGKVLDGRNRVLACRAAGVEPRFVEWQANGNDTSPIAWVISQNIKRRSLNATQKAVIAFLALPLFEAEAKVRQKEHAGIAPGKSKNTPPKNGGSDSGDYGESAKQAAKKIGAGHQYVSDVKRIAKKMPGLISKMQSGEMTIAEALFETGFSRKDPWKLEVERRKQQAQREYRDRKKERSYREPRLSEEDEAYARTCWRIGTKTPEIRTAAIEVINAGNRAMAKKHHPDVGGTIEVMAR